MCYRILKLGRGHKLTLVYMFKHIKHMKEKKSGIKICTNQGTPIQIESRTHSRCNLQLRHAMKKMSKVMEKTIANTHYM
jgi:hypothetical protein